jgi:hypothetical protein
MAIAQATMFEEVPSDPPPVETVRFNWYELYCKERYAMRPDWEIYSWKANGGERKIPGAFVVVEGGVYKEKITKGKRKGRTNYSKPEPGSKMTFSIVADELDKFKAEWSARTGKCANCYGTGKEWDGWDHIEGTRYRGCMKCKETGKFQAT